MKTTRYIIAAIGLLLAASACKQDEALDWRELNTQWLRNNKADKAETWFHAHYPDGTYNPDCFHVLESGVQYYVLYEGVEPQVNPLGSLYAYYKGRLITDNVFDSTATQPSQFVLSTLVDGMSEVLPKMKTKGEFIIFIPADQAYGKTSIGASGSSNYVPPYSTLIFNVKVDGLIN